ncbi:MAG TPA: hypothetical protein VEV43_02630 [Actinomycetota bacterium]|nr:hypothetical protein [Actinomycetota bacterium]
MILSLWLWDEAWLVPTVTGSLAVLSLGARRLRWARRIDRERLLPAGPTGDPQNEAWRRIMSREAWEEAFAWLGWEPSAGATTRWLIYRFAFVALAAAPLASSLREG